MLIKTSENRPNPDEPKSSERVVTSIPEYAFEQRGVTKRGVIERQAQMGRFRADRRVETERVDGAVVLRQFTGDRTLKWATRLFRRGWDAIKWD